MECSVFPTNCLAIHSILLLRKPGGVAFVLPATGSPFGGVSPAQRRCCRLGVKPLPVRLLPLWSEGEVWWRHGSDLEVGAPVTANPTVEDRWC